MHGLSPAPIAIFFEFDFALHELFVFARPVVRALALATGEFNQSFLRHDERTISYRGKEVKLV